MPRDTGYEKATVFNAGGLRRGHWDLVLRTDLPSPHGNEPVVSLAAHSPTTYLTPKLARELAASLSDLAELIERDS